MRIVILSDYFPPYAPGGAEQSVFDLAQEFKQKGHEVFVITTCAEKSDERSLDYRGLNVFKVYSNYHERWRAYLSLYNSQTVRKVEKILKEIRPDIVHANNIHYHLSYYCLKIAKKYAKGVFITLRDVMAFNYEKLHTKRYLEKLDYRTSWFDHLRQAGLRYNPIRNIIIRRYLKYTNRVFTISNALKQALNENKIKNVEVIYNGIDLENWKEDPGGVKNFKEKYNIQNKKVILFGGRLSALKGGGQIIWVMKDVVGQVPEAILFIAGKKSRYVQEMMRLAHELGIENHIIFTDWLDREQIKLACFCSDLVVIPSICFDSFNLFNIEAMAAKKPVVGTCFGGTPEIVVDEKTGFIVNPRDTAGMAEKIIELLKNPQKVKQFGEAGYLRVKEKFNLDKQSDKYLDYFSNALNSSATFLGQRP